MGQKVVSAALNIPHEKAVNQESSVYKSISLGNLAKLH
jgi:hypothetical protein